jgi:hypothetical protein
MTELYPLFEHFPKIPRLSNAGMVITEKIDGTNAQIRILEDGRILVGSRNRYITTEADNYGFARWVETHKEELRGLGVGTHYGEWYGTGIQRGYHLSEKRFALFNTSQWNENHLPPNCCGVVPVLYAGKFDPARIQEALEGLRTNGSVLVPGFPEPEGVVVYLPITHSRYKVLLENDDGHKGQKEEG